MKPFTLLLAAITLLSVSCKNSANDKAPDEGTVKGEIYKSAEIGWSIEIPKGWDIISRDQLESNDAKGKSALEKQAGKPVDISDLKHLISFQKDRFNMLASTSEPFVGDSLVYDSANHALDQLLYSTFVSQGVSADTASGTVMVDGLKFNAFYTTINSPTGAVLLKQVLYSRLINGYDFGVNINYTNDSCKKIMTAAFMNSKFDKK